MKGKSEKSNCRDEQKNYMKIKMRLESQPNIGI